MFHITESNKPESGVTIEASLTLLQTNKIGFCANMYKLCSKIMMYIIVRFEKFMWVWHNSTRSTKVFWFSQSGGQNSPFHHLFYLGLKEKENPHLLWFPKRPKLIVFVGKKSILCGQSARTNYYLVLLTDSIERERLELITCAVPV